MQYLISGSELLAKEKDFKLVGRSADIKRLSSVLMRSKAASVILVGPGGVGATALCMGLQAAKELPDATFDIISKRLFWLKTDELFGSGDMAEVNKGFNSIVAVMKRTSDSILIIEDTRDFIEACRTNGCSHFINSLNAMVKNGDTQVILEAKDKDIELVLSAHSDMRQCYTLIDLTEPAGTELQEIVLNSATRLEQHHEIKIAPEAVETAIELTTKYRTKDASLSRAQPERSTNLLDRALATYRLDAHKTHPKIATLAKNDPQIPELTKEFEVTQARLKSLFRLQRDAEIAIVNLEEQVEAQKKIEAEAVEAPEPEQPSRRIQIFSNNAKAAGFDNAKVRALKDEIAKFTTIANENRAEYDVLTESINSQLLLTKDIVLAEFSRLSGIPANKLNEDERAKLLNLEKTLNSRVFGQSSVIAKIANAIKVARIGHRNGGKPQASFLIMGPSGTGKTEVCKALAHALKDDEAALLRFDMSEYMEKHSVAKLIGAPAGYEGSDRSGALTDAMRANPNRIILFDEIEKADPAIFDLFLQILSDGRLTDNYGRLVNFSESMIMMTTNIGQSYLLDTSLTNEESEKLANIELDQKYRPEFLNRFSGRENIVCFSRLELDSIEKIVKRELADMTKAYRQSGVEVKVSDESVTAFCADHYNPANGARGLQGYVVSNIEPKVVNLILEDKILTPNLELKYIKESQTFEAVFT